MRQSTRNLLIAVSVLCLLFLSGNTLLAQHEPYITHNTRPLITEGPLLAAPTEDGITIVWQTDTDCHSRVEFGVSPDLGTVAENDRHGLLPIGKIHSVRLSGLKPGQTYHYKVVSTRVVKMKAYWPEKGLSIESAVHNFTLPDQTSSKVSFSFVTDTQHEDLSRLGENLDIVDWANSDFFVHGGDAFGALDSEDQLFGKFLNPIAERLGGSKPLVFIRGNHDMRGAFSRHLFDYLPGPNDQFYYTFDAGPAHFIVIDTGEDKDDDTNVYAGLNRTEPYREREFEWFETHVNTNQRIGEAPFRVILMHSPSWGWVDGGTEKWTELANRASVDLVISGHRHRFSWSPPGTDGRNYGVLVVGQDQTALVQVSETEIEMRVTDVAGAEVGVISLPRRSR